MKNKTSLLLIEQLVMILVFALGATLCLQAFVKADQISRQSAQRDEAVVWAQSAADTIKSCSGDMEQTAQLLQGQVTDGVLQAERNGLQLTVRAEPTEMAGLAQSTVQVTDLQSGQILFTVTVAWQEVSG